MKTIEQIQENVLETVKPTIDEFKGMIRNFWEKGWNNYQQALTEYEGTEFYQKRMANGLKWYEDMKRCYTRIADSTFKSESCTVEEAIDKLKKNEENYVQGLDMAKEHSIKRHYQTLCGYVNDARYNSQDEKNNRNIIKSGILSIRSYCRSREEFEMKREIEVNRNVEAVTAKLNEQIEKKLSPIKGSIESFNLIHFGAQQNNYVGEWKVTTETGNYIFKTSCILAGGYNIQCLHIRYIANLKQLKK